MNTKLIMISAAVFLLLLGIGFTFFGSEIAIFTGTGLSNTFKLILQLLGALYFAFGLLNWMAKGSSIGSIYNRPVAMANFAHFFIGGIALVKTVINNPGISMAFWILAILYALFALLFAGLLFTKRLPN